MVGWEKVQVVKWRSEGNCFRVITWTTFICIWKCDNALFRWSKQSSLFDGCLQAKEK